MKIFLISFLVFSYLSCICSRWIYSKQSYVTPITKLNFESQIKKIRQTTKQLTFVQYYSSSGIYELYLLIYFKDRKSTGFVEEYDKFTNDYRGLFRIGACDCDTEAEICQKEKVTSYPTFRLYPPLPVPSIDYEGELDIQKMIKFAAPYISSNVMNINDDNIESFLKDSPSVPKVLLFTDKKGIPMTYKGLSVSFEKKLFFGIVKSEQQSIINDYNIKNFPSIIVIKTNEKKPIPYKGQMKFMDIHDFLNIYSETFVPNTKDSGDTKPWTTEMVPELHEKSSNDICYKVEGALCVIIFSEGKPNKSQLEVLKTCHRRYERTISRGTHFKFMWLDVNKEKNWKNLFNFESYPQIIALNPGRRKRYVQHEGPINQDSLGSTLERIMGGDARFTLIKKEMPNFEFRKDI